MKTNPEPLEAAYHAAEEDERAETHRLIGAVRQIAAGAVARPDWRSRVPDVLRLLDALDNYDRARARTAAALLALEDARRG